jgi:acetyl esterase/lipase
MVQHRRLSAWALLGIAAWLLMGETALGPAARRLEAAGPGQTLESAPRLKPVSGGWSVQRNVVFRQLDDRPLTADVYRPEPRTSAAAGSSGGSRPLSHHRRPKPAVLLIHGGAWVSGAKWHLSSFAQQVAQAGMVAVSINYRLAPEHLFPAQLEDAAAALEWMVEQADPLEIDAQRIGLWGYSAGGHLAALLAAGQTGSGRAPASLLACAVVGGAPCDLDFLTPNDRTLARVFGGTPAELPQRYEQATPLNHVQSHLPPLMLFHGTQDLLVPPQCSQRFADRAAQAGVDVQLLWVEGQGHLGTFLSPQARTASIDFLLQHLQPRPPHG